MKLLGKLFSHPDPHKGQTLADEKFVSPSLRPGDLQTVFEDHVLSVMRPSSDPPQAPASPKVVGPQRLAELLLGLRAPFPSDHDVRTKFKVVSVDLSDSDASATTTVYYQAASGQTSQTATRKCRWLRSEGEEGKPPKLLGIEVVSYEETQYRGSGDALFADCTEAVLGADKSYQEQLSRPLEFWRARLDASLGTGLASYVGLAIGDVNGDQLDDLYVCQSGGMPNRLLVQNPDGTVTDVAAEAGVDFLDLSRSALLVDFDRDGDQDLVFSSSSKVIFLENQTVGSATKFTIRETVQTGAEIFSLAAADYDQDGDIDLYTCGYTKSFVVAGQSTALGMPIPYHDANNGGVSKLLRNEIQGKTWRFEDVTAEAGLDQNNNRFSLAASWEDYDNDGDLDLYVANDFGRNYLFRNDRGHFVDIAAEAGVEDLSAGMSVAWTDYDHDGWMDLYVSNMFSAAGNRIAYQRKFQAKVSSDERAQFQRHARGNTLFRNTGDGSFEDVSLSAAVTMGRWAWSSNFLDINNDG